MSDEFFGIDTRPPDNPSRERTPLPLPKDVKSRLILAYAEWQDAGATVHPAATDGTKTPLNLPGCGSKLPGGGYGFGWGAVRDGLVPMVSLDYFADLVNSDRSHGICVLLPRTGNLAMLEIEAVARPLLPAIAAEAKRLGGYDTLASIVEGYTEESTRGGLHFPFRVADAPSVPSKKIAYLTGFPKEKLACEVLGGGKQFIAAPSCGRTHESGLPYTAIYGSPSTIVTITAEQQQLLYRAFESIDDRPRQSRSSERPPPAYPSNDAIVDFNRRATWERILEKQGWRKSRTSQYTTPDGSVGVRTHWTRPGKDRGTSATTSGGYIYCFSTAAETGLPSFDPGEQATERHNQRRSKFEVFAIYEHGGDHEAALAAIRSQGYGIPSYDVVSESEIAEVGKTANILRERLHHGEVPIAELRDLISRTLSVDLLVTAANREASAVGHPLVPRSPPPDRNDRRLRKGFEGLSAAVLEEVCRDQSITLDDSTRTLRRIAHG